MKFKYTSMIQMHLRDRETFNEIIGKRNNAFGQHTRNLYKFKILKMNHNKKMNPGKELYKNLMLMVGVHMTVTVSL